jgi:hypothetical protein
MVKKSSGGKSRNGADKKLSVILEILEQYKAGHPKAEVDARRYNSASIRVRVIDPHFEGMHLADRDNELWNLLQVLPDDAIADVTMLVLLAPSELSSSLANLEYEQPSGSQL